MQTLASILAGIPSNPYQMASGISPLLTQQHMLGAPQQPGQQFGQPQPIPAQMLPGMGGPQLGGLGSLGAMAGGMTGAY